MPVAAEDSLVASIIACLIVLGLIAAWFGTRQR